LLGVDHAAWYSLNDPFDALLGDKLTPSKAVRARIVGTLIVRALRLSAVLFHDPPHLVHPFFNDVVRFAVVLVGNRRPDILREMSQKG
jgi:hypothetical protein